jgi:hypothetical protein
MSGAGRARFEITILLYPDRPTQSAIGLPKAVRSLQDGTVSKIPEGMGDGQALYVVARRVLLDALVALHDQDDAITIVGAQAIYLRSVDLDLSVAAYTSDADLGLDPQHLVDEPRLQQAMTNAGFVRASADLAGSWSREERVGDHVVKIPVDLLVPEDLSEGGRRSVQIPPHDKMSARRVPGLEAAVVDNDVMAVTSLEPGVDTRVIMASVAGPAALLVAKAYKIRDRVEKPGKSRLTDKDAGDVVRLMMIDEGPLEVAKRFHKLLVDDRTSEVVQTGLGYLDDLFGARATIGTEMAVAALAGGLDERTIRALAPGYVAALLQALN